MRLTPDTRGASIPLTHAMTLGITALLMASLLVGAGTFLSNQQETVAREQLGDVAGDVVGQLNTLDRLNATGEAVSATFEPSYKRTAGGAPYNIALIPDGAGPSTRATLFVNSTAMDHPISMPIEMDTTMVEGRARGENPTLWLCDDGSGDRVITLGASCP